MYGTEQFIRSPDDTTYKTWHPSLVPVLNGQRIKRGRGGIEAYPPDTIFLTLDEFFEFAERIQNGW